MSQLLCHCLAVDEADVRRAIRQGARTVEQVTDRCEAGGGCGSCHGGITTLIDEEVRRRVRRGDTAVAVVQLALFGGEKRPL